MSYTMMTPPAYHAVPTRRSFAPPPQPPPPGSSAPPPPPLQPPPSGGLMVNNHQAYSAKQNAASSTPKPRKVEWPKSVREYVQRAFAAENQDHLVSRQDMELRLKVVIGDSVKENTMLSIDWDNLLLPQQLIRQERSLVATAETAYPASSPPADQAFQEPQISNIHSSRLANITAYASEACTNKRKSADDHARSERLGPAKVPPWQQLEADQRPTPDASIFEARLSEPDKKSLLDGPLQTTSKSQSRRQRFNASKDEYDTNFRNFGPRAPTPPPSATQGPVVGRCQRLEKKYFRLTSAPNPDDVRPLPVLEAALDFLKKKWKRENNYSYICDQLKSLRQDLTVQHIRTSFTLSVYELHARIALEKGDLGEYNQCQTQLRTLYAHQQQQHSGQNPGGHPHEFKAYRILYFLHTCNRTAMNDVLADLTPAEKKHHAIKHALDTRSALASGNYSRFFQLYLDTPNMGAYLMDMFVGRERLVALSHICVAYKPDVRLRFITEDLAFESDEESARFICEFGGQEYLDTINGEVRLLTGKALRFFETARAAAFKTVDIKGQI